MSLLEVEDLSAGYEDISVLHGLSLHVDEGEIVALLGPNGHGKSTLLKTMAGLVPAARGSIRLRDRDISRLPSHRRVRLGLAYIAEERHLFAAMTVHENLLLGAIGPRGRAHVQDKLSEAYELFPRLAERRFQRCETMSGGEARMVAIARGLMSGADLLLIDEPSIGLSPSMRDTVYDAVRRINAELGMTVLLVEQELEYPLALADRVYMLKHGQVLFERDREAASADEIREAYF